jgi:hypothetical protein
MRRFTIDDTFLDPLSETEKRNGESIKLFVSSLLSLLSDSPLGPNKPPRTFSRFLKNLQKNGVKATVIRFTSLAHLLVSSPTGHTTSSIGDWIDGFDDTPVFQEYHQFYRTGDITIVRWLYTFLNFGKKLEFVDPEFNETAFRGWSDIEKRLSDLILPEDICSHLRLILQVGLPPFRIRDFRPKFGPGSVAERGIGRRISKLGSLDYDNVLDRIFFKDLIGILGSDEDDGLKVEKVIPIPHLWSPDNGVCSRTSLLTFVPKNVKVSRSICMEPNTLMFFQQGVLDQMSRLLRISHFGHFIHLRDQSFNRKLSELGSKTGLIDTLDLSSASDSLSYELVKKIFPTSWQIVMRATRSHKVKLPNGDVLTMKKFAPMGSALCFPTQCIVFCAVSILSACLDSYGKSGSTDTFSSWLSPQHIVEVIAKFWQHPSTTVVDGEYQPLGIYGDDICVDSQLTSTIMSILESLGFVVNVEKSFTSTQLFRESCGGFYLKGHDITPLYFSIKGVREVTNPEHVASHVHLINECWKRRYKFLYRFLRHSMLAWGSDSNPIPHVTDSNIFGILCNTPRNNHLRRRYNKNYQRDEIRVWTIAYTVRFFPGNLLGALESYEHMRWWAGRPRAEDSDDDLSSVPRYDTGRPGLRWRWIPVQ